MNVLAATSSSLAAENQPTLEDFGHDVWWIVLIKIVGIFVVLVLLTLFAIVFERKVVARMQQRIGPNRVGPRGYLQSLADGLKLAFKEDIMPALADKPVYFLAPVLATVPAFLAFSVIPIGPTVSIFGERTPLQLTDAPIGVLIVLACSAMGVYGIVLAGWASGSTYPLLGSLRSAAQSMEMAYTKALHLLRRAEAVLGFSLTRRTIGGRGGGGSVLTDEAKEFMQRYESYRDECVRADRERFAQYFADEK